MTLTRTAPTLTVCVLLLCTEASVVARGTSDGVDTEYTALLLGATSLEILFHRLELNEQGGPDTAQIPVTELPLRIEVGTYIDMLGLEDVIYPDNPVSSSDNVAPLANYGKHILDQLDEAHQAAFLVGWYGTILLNGDDASSASNLVCDFAQDAGFETYNCTEDPRAFIIQLLAKARSPD